MKILKFLIISFAMISITSCIDRDSDDNYEKIKQLQENNANNQENNAIIQDEVGTPIVVTPPK